LYGRARRDDRGARPVDRSAKAYWSAHLALLNTAGYRALPDFARSHAPGPRIVWALEGTRSHGTGLPRALQACGERVVEVDRPKRPVRKHWLPMILLKQLALPRVRYPLLEEEPRVVVQRG